MKSRRLDVVAATDVSEEGTAGDLCAFAILVEDVSCCVTDVETFACPFLVGF